MHRLSVIPRSYLYLALDRILKSIVILKPDKGNGVVLLDRSAYSRKVYDVLEDTGKFTKIASDELYDVIIRLEDKMTRLLKKSQREWCDLSRDLQGLVTIWLEAWNFVWFTKGTQGKLSH